MRNILLTLLFTLLFIHPGYAQHTGNIEYSTPFEEPEAGWNKVLQLSNGNTFFFHFTKKNGIEVSVYDKSRKLISSKQVTSELWEPRKMRDSKIEGMYEIAGQPVIFLHQLIDNTPTLFRIKFNANTGEMDGEKQICKLPKYRAGAAWAMMVGGVEPADFYVEKDPNSDNYAVINFNSFAHESDERIEVVHYGIADGNHKILSRAFYDAQGFKYTRFIGMTVNGDKSVYLCAYGFNTQNSGGKDSRVIVSRLDKGAKEFTNKLIDFTDDFKDTKGIMQYNPGTGMLQLLTVTFINGKSNWFSGRTVSTYLVLMSFIDPESLFIVSTKPVMGQKISEYVADKFGDEKGFSGMPQDMIINKDYSTTVLFEDMYKETMMQNGRVVSVKTYLRNAGLSELDNKGAELEGYAFAKSQMANGEINPLYISQKGKGYWSYRGMRGISFGYIDNNAFMSYDYINTDKNRYILFNDYPDNFLGDDHKKKKTVVTISSANTGCYKMNNGKMEKYFLFGAPKEDDESRFCYVESSHFNKQTNVYATLLMEKTGKKKEAKIAWIKFD